MAHTDTFYVSTKDNKVRPVKGNPIGYFNPSWKSENYGKAKYCIEVFGNFNNEDTAKKIRDIIDEKGLSDKLFHIRVEMK